MFRVMAVILVCLAAVPALCQSTSKYQVGTITDVKQHAPAGGAASEVVRCDVSPKVDDTIYQVLYTPPLGMITVRYAAGRQILVLVGKTTITYNEILGNSMEVPIASKKPAPNDKQSK